jgi:phosphoenolpyruvate synthase/pyruvate phosphate dikinase
MLNWTHPAHARKHFKDVQDFEFTIQDGKVFMLQTRNGKRTGLAAVRFAIEMEKEKLIDWKTAIRSRAGRSTRSGPGPGV